MCRATLQAVYVGGAITCGLGGDNHTTNCPWNSTCAGSGVFAFEIALNGDAVLSVGGGISPNCEVPVPACGDAGAVGNIECELSLDIKDGDVLSPEWASSHASDVGVVAVDVFGRVRCEAGSYFNTTATTDGDICSPCPAGRYCPESGMTQDSLPEQACGSPAFYCPVGSVDKVPLSVGHYGLTAAGSNESGLFFASQVICEAGAYCEGGKKYLCPAGTYGGTQGLSGPACSGQCAPGSAAKEGSTSCTSCAAGKFASQVGATTCEPCPAGYFCPPASQSPELCGTPGDPAVYCPEGSDRPVAVPFGQYGIGDVANGTGLGYVAATPCDPGFYCPPGEGVRIPCAPGRYASFGGLVSEVCMGPCASGHWCSAGSTSSTQHRCGGWNFYCPAGASEALRVGVGNYSIGGADQASGTDMSAQALCEAGYYCTDGRRYPCPRGRFGNSTGMSTDQCSGECEAGYYCPQPATTGRARKCGDPRYFCPARSDAKRATRSGHYTLPEGSDVATEERICPLAHYCTDGRKTICPAGVYGDVEGLGTDRCGGPCLPGYYCPVGTASAHAHECGSKDDSSLYCPLGSVEPSICPEGWYVKPERSQDPDKANVGDRIDVCPAGYYCSRGLRHECQDGHIGPSSSAPYSVSTCAGPCPPGYHEADRVRCAACDSPTGFCEGALRSSVSVFTGHHSVRTPWTEEELLLPYNQRKVTYSSQRPCSPGRYCRDGVVRDCPCGRYGDRHEETDPQCTDAVPPGRYSESGSTAGEECGGIGVYCPQTVQTFSSYNRDTRKWETFETRTSVCVPVAVSFGFYSACGSAQDLHSCAPELRSTQHRCRPGYVCQSGALVPCEAGTFNPDSGQERVPGPDATVWAFNPCRNCAAGRYCPLASAAQLPCSAPRYYCPAASARPTPVSIGFYSTGGPPTLRSTQTACSPGSYCVMGLRVPCPGGTWESKLAQTRCSGVCFEGYRCSGGDHQGDPQRCTTDTTAPEHYYCPSGSVESRVARAGTFTVPKTPLSWRPAEWLLHHKQQRTGALKCEPGSWCVRGVAHACAPGRFGAEHGLATSSCTGKCPTGFFCSEASENPLSQDCRGADQYCPRGSGRPVPVPEGYQSLNLEVAEETDVLLLEDGFTDPRTASSRWFATVGGSYTSTCTLRDGAFVFEGGRSDSFELTSQPFVLSASTVEARLEFEMSFGGDDGSADCSVLPSAQVVVELGVGSPLQTTRSWTAATLITSEYAPSLWHSINLPVGVTNTTGPDGVGDVQGEDASMFFRISVPKAASTSLGDVIMFDNIRVVSKEVEYIVFVGDDDEHITTKVTWAGSPASLFSDDFEDYNFTARQWAVLPHGMRHTVDLSAGNTLVFSNKTYVAESASIALRPGSWLQFDHNIGGNLGLVSDAREAGLFLEWRWGDADPASRFIAGNVIQNDAGLMADACPAGTSVVSVRSPADFDEVMEWIDHHQAAVAFHNDTVFFVDLVSLNGQFLHTSRGQWAPTFLQHDSLPAELYNATKATCSVRDAVEPVLVPLIRRRGVAPITETEDGIVDHCEFNTTGVVICEASTEAGETWTPLRQGGVPLGGNGLLRGALRAWRHINLPFPDIDDSIGSVVLRMHSNINGLGVVLVDNVQVMHGTTETRSVATSPLRLRASARPCGSSGWWCDRGIAHNATEGYYTVGGQGPTTRTAEILCPGGFYCTRGIKRECPQGRICTPGSSAPEAGPCAPPPVWCAAGSEEPILVRPGYFSLRSGGTNIGEAPCADLESYCKDGLRRKTPPGWYAFGETNMTLAEIEPCGDVSVFCIRGARFLAAPGRFTIGSTSDGLYQWRDENCGGVDHWCHGGVRYEASQGFYTVPREGHPTNRTGQAVCEPGFFCDGGSRFACPYGTYNELQGMYSETACLKCPAGTFNDRRGVALQSDACQPCPTFENSTVGARVCWPGVVSVTAVDGAPLQPGLGIGDYLIVQFTKATNTPNVRFAAVSTICNLSAAVGTVDGQWSDDGDSLVIRISDSSMAADPALTRVGLLNLRVLVSGGLLDAAELSQSARTYDPVVVEGTWGRWPAPEIEHLEAFDSGVQQAGVGNGDTLIIRFNMMVMTPNVATTVDVDALFEFSSPMAKAYSGTWNDDHRTLTLRVDDPSGVDQPMVAVGVLFVSVHPDAALLARDQDSPPSITGATLEAGTWGDVPESVLLGVDSKTSIEVVWRPPTTNYGYLIGRYLLEWATNAEFNPLVNSTILEVPPGRESYSFIAQDIMNGTDYFFRMRAENIGRFGPIKASYPDAIQTGLPDVKAITGGTEMATLGGEEVILIGKNFGREGSTALSAQYTNGNYTFDAASCVVWAAGTQVRCVSSAGVGAGHRWRVRVGKFWSPLSPPTATTSYAAPTVAAFEGPGAAGGTTAGWQLVTVRGTQLGRRVDDAVAGVQYSTETKEGRKISFKAQNCSIVEDHFALECYTAAGAGTALEWKVFVAGQESVAPATRYAAPVVVGISAPSWSPGVDPEHLDTRGGEPLNISGFDFGPIDTDIPLHVTYGPSGIQYTASRCRVAVAHTSIICYTVQGVGARHRWVVTRLEQSSPPSHVTTSFAPPRITDVTPTSGPTAGGWTLSLSGLNFGDGTELRVMLNGAAFTNYVRDSHIMLTMNIAAGEGRDNEVRFSVGQQSSNSVYFSYNQPRIDSMDILEVEPDGTVKVLVLGDSFGFGPSTRVTIGGDDCVDVVVVAHAEIQCITTVLEGDMVVSVGGRDSAAVRYDYFELLTPPVIASISPELAPTVGVPTLEIVGTYFKNSGGKVLVIPTRGAAPEGTVDISGSGNETTVEGLFVPFNTTLLDSTQQQRECQLSTHEDERITCSFPPGQGTVMIQIIVRRLESTLFKYEFSPPLISSVEPRALPTSGGTINITGHDFGIAGNVLLDMDGELSDCDVLGWNHSRVTCVVPPGGVTQIRLRLCVSGQCTEDELLSYLPPRIFNATPEVIETKGSMSIVLDGENFALDGWVVLGTSMCEVTVWNHTRVVCIAPEGEGARVPVVLHTDYQSTGGAAAGVGSEADVYIAYGPPELHSVAPTEEARTVGGWVLHLEGRNFGLEPKIFVADTSFRQRAASGLGSSTPGVSCAITQQSHTMLRCIAPPGLGETVLVAVHVAAQESNTAEFAYASPVVDSVTPNTFDAHSPAELAISGRNFGSQLPDNFAVHIDGRPCLDGAGGWRGRDSHVTCTSPGAHFVGPINLTVTVQNLTSEHAWISAACVAGFFGIEGEMCSDCPEGAVCDGGGALPYPKVGYWRMEPYPYEFMRCQPEIACPGGPDSPCAEGYEGEVCRECSFRWYRVQEQCVPCPDHAWLLILGFITAVIAVGAVAYWLNKRRVNLSGLTVGVDFAQSASVFARFEFAWPPLLLDAFKFISLFTLNIDVVAPSCSIKWSYSLRFYSIQAVPAFVGSSLLVAFIVITGAKLLWRCGQRGCAYLGKRRQAARFLMGSDALKKIKERSRLRAQKLAAKHLGRKGPREKLDLKLHDVFVGMFLSANYYVYLVVASSALEIFDCSENANGLITLDAEPSLTCWEGVHDELWPYALASLIVYGLGIPGLFGWIVWHYRQDIRYDQAQRSRGEGDTMANPVIRTRIRFAKLYMDFKPEVYYWRLWLIARKAMLAAIALMFNQNAMFQVTQLRQRCGKLCSCSPASPCVRAGVGEHRGHVYGLRPPRACQTLPTARFHQQDLARAVGARAQSSKPQRPHSPAESHPAGRRPEEAEGRHVRGGLQHAGERVPRVFDAVASVGHDLQQCSLATGLAGVRHVDLHCAGSNHCQ